jgi:hypothetical protein
VKHVAIQWHSPVWPDICQQPFSIHAVSIRVLKLYVPVKALVLVDSKEDVGRLLILSGVPKCELEP